MAEGSEPLNIDLEIDELENRLERLRALYESYFLGIEKIEPTVPRKDVDRRIWVLRREKFRNTAKRFKLQVLIQRYNTFQQYWGRICREIENGTYKRHVLRAEKLMDQPLTISAKKRGRRRQDEETTLQEEREPETQSSEVDELDSILGLKPTAQKPPGSNAPVAAPQARPTTQPRSKFQLQKLDLDIEDIIGGGAAPISHRPPTNPGPIAAPGARRPSVAPASSPSGLQPPPASGPPVSRKAPPSVGPMAGVRPRLPKGMAPPTAGPPISQRSPERPLPSSPAAASSPRAAPPPIPSRPPTSPEPGRPSRRPPPIPSRAPPPVPPPRLPPSRPPTAPAAAPKPQPAPAARPHAAARPPAPAGGLSDERVRELHTRLSDAKRQTNDGKAVSLDGLAKQLRTAEENLRRQHGNRRIDFDVVIKDGKAVVKPIVK